MKQQEPYQSAAISKGPATVIPFRPLRPEPATVPAQPQQEVPAALQRRALRPRKLWGREDGFTMAGARR